MPTAWIGLARRTPTHQLWPIARAIRADSAERRHRNASCQETFLKKLTLLTAGPVEVDDAVLAALAEPTLPHYGPPWMPAYESTIFLLHELFETDHDVLLMPGPGSGALDTGIGSLIPPGSTVCVPVNGFFGGRVRQMVEAYDIHAAVIDFPQGAAIDPDALRRFLLREIPRAQAEDRPLKALAVVHHETSTGVLNPLEAIAAVARDLNLVLIVDAVASAGGTRLPVDAWGIDICVAVPNKCLGAPPGVAMVTVSPRAWQMAEANPARHGWYHDLRTWAWYRKHEEHWHPYPTTLPTNVIVALRKALSIVLHDKGVETHRGEIQLAAQHIREGMDEFGFELFPDPRNAAPMLSAFRSRPGIDTGQMTKYLLDECGLMISGGLGDLAGKIFRIGHMGGAARPEVTGALLAGVGEFLKSKNGSIEY
jgi:alanine-glyoxylate transaminase / serine-glyoxylate transaminase / serine-pyruvate transaminase